MERLSNYAASSTEVSNGMLYSWLQSSNRGTDDDFMLQVLPEFLQVEAFAKLNNYIGKVNLAWYLQIIHGFVSFH